MSGSPPVVVYIGGYSRSGSTLLDLILSRALGAFGGGELCRLPADWSVRRCSCGQRYPDCAFWGGLTLVAEDDRRRAARRVEGGRLARGLRRAGRRDRELHRDTIRRVFGHAAAMSGCDVVIDSSKTARAAVGRARALAGAGLDVRYVHLVRSPYGVADSYERIGSNIAFEHGLEQPRGRVLRATVGWALANRAAERDRRAAPWPTSVVAYEDLVRDPGPVARRVIRELGFTAPASTPAVEFEDPGGHAVAGNRMRREDGVVRVETKVVPVIGEGLSRPRRAMVNGVASLLGDRGYRRVRGAIPSSPGAGARVGERGDALRVVHICTRFGGGGSEQRIVDAVEALPDADHLLLTGPESDGARLARVLPQVDVWTVPGLDARTFSPVGDLSAARVLSRFMARASPDVVHTVQSKAGLLGRLCAPAGALRVHSVSMLNFGPAFARPLSLLARAVERSLASRTDRFLVAGTDLRDLYVGSGIARHEDYEVVRATFDAASVVRWRDARTDDARAAFGLPPDSPVVGFVGRMEPRKGVGDLSRIWSRVLAREPATLIALAGAGPLLDETVSQLRSVGADREAVRVLGRVDDVPRLLRGVDCVVLPSRTEGVPQVLVQACAVGTPFVAFDVPGVRELLALGASGTVVEPGDVAGMSDAIAGWLGNRPAGPAPNLSSWEREVVHAAWRRVLVP